MLISKPFEIMRPSDCDPGDVIELSVDGSRVFAVVTLASERKFAVGFCSSEANYRPHIYPTDGAWDDDCLYYPDAVLEIIQISSDFNDAEKLGSLRLIKDTVAIRASTLGRPPQRYWIDLVEAARIAQQPQGTEFYAVRWKLWAHSDHRTMVGAPPLADVTAQPAPPRQ